MTDSNDIYKPEYVEDLFDRCSSSYRRWSLVASFGMVLVWRNKCVLSIPEHTNSEGTFIDLMAGTGEVWPKLMRRFPNLTRIQAIDNSSRMHEEAMLRLHKGKNERISHLKANTLEIDLPENSADCVVSTFGLKTFNASQQFQIAKQVSRVLKPGGTFSFIEASDPTDWKLRSLYRFYMDNCLPLVERFLLKGAQDFSMIGTYTQNFVNCDTFSEALASNGLTVTRYSHFFGCATGVYGSKPEN